MIPIGQTIELPGYAFLGEKKIQGSLMGSNHFPVDMPRLVDMYLAGKLKLDEMISRRIKLEEVNEAFAEMKRGEIARSVIVFDAAPPGGPRAPGQGCTGEQGGGANDQGVHVHPIGAGSDVRARADGARPGVRPT